VKKIYPVSAFYWVRTRDNVIVVPCEDAHEYYLHERNDKTLTQSIDTASIHEMHDVRSLKRRPRVFHLVYETWRDIYKHLKAEGLHTLENPKFTEVIKKAKPLCPKKDKAIFEHLFFGIDPRSLPHIDPLLLRTPREVIEDLLDY